MFLICLLLLSASQYVASASMNDFYSFELINQLTSISVGGVDYVAWVSTVQGATNIWGAKGPNFTPKQLTTNTQDNGIFLTSVTFAPDASRIWFVSAPSDNSNPTFALIPPVATIMTVDFSGNQAAVASTGLFEISGPSSCVYTSGPAVVEATIGSDGSIKRTTLFQIQGDQGYCSDFEWNSDFTSMVFTNYRGDHSFIGLYTRGASALQWLGPSFDSDSNPTWSPDGTTVVWYRMIPKQKKDATVHRTDFMILSFVIGSPESNIIFVDNNVGYPTSYGWGVRALQFWNDQYVLFPCEMTGWLHVCALNLHDDSSFDLIGSYQTCEVQDYIPYNSTHLLISHNCNNLDTLSIALVDRNGNVMSLVENDIHHNAGVADFGYALAPLTSLGNFAFIESSVNTSTQVSIQSLTSGARTELQTQKLHDTKFNPSLFVTPQPIEFQSTDSKFTIHAQLFLPTTPVPGAPAVIFTHGGPMRQMYNCFHFSQDYAQLYALNQYLVSQGIVVLSINYRMGIGYGKAFRDCDKCGNYGGAEYQDVLAGNLWLRQNLSNVIDSSKIGIYGLSYGGLNCLQALSRNSNFFAVGVANAPVFNWISQSRFDGVTVYDYDFQMPGQALSDGPESDFATPYWTNIVNQNQATAYMASPIGHLENFTSPILIIHGDSDRNVAVQESIGLIRALRRRGNALVYTMMFPNERHGLALYQNDVLAAQATAEMLTSYLIQNNERFTFSIPGKVQGY